MKKQSQGSMAYDGMGSACCEPYNKSLQHTAAGVPAAKANYGRGPTVAGKTGHSVPNPTAASGKINGGATVKFPGTSINVGRGPTKVGSK